MPQACLLLLNTRAANGSAARRLPQLRAALAVQSQQAGRGADVELAATSSAAEALACVQALPKGSRVILAGGDGSIHAVLPAVLERGLELALLPLGSGNDSARAFGVARLPWRAALAHALAAPARRIDVGWLRTLQGRTPFVSSLAAGFDAAVGLRAIHGPAWLRGQPRYLWATLGEIAALRHRRLRVSAGDDCLHDGPVLLASILNTPSYGSGMPVLPHARIDDGALDALIIGPFGRLGTLAMLPRLLTGTHLGHRLVRTQAFQSLDFACDEPMPLAAEGEPLAPAARFSVEIAAAALPAVLAR